MSSGKKKKVEKRQDERMPADQIFAALTVQGFQGSDQGFGVVQNVSEDGICIQTPQPPPKACGVELRISVCEEVHVVQATVRWVRPTDRGGYEVGMEFAPADHGRLMFLKSFLEEQYRAPS
ncbi:MAG: PilZ domain-containing protein [Planctomycetota bacterium]|jgi:hypothetical protein